MFRRSSLLLLALAVLAPRPAHAQLQIVEDWSSPTATIAGDRWETAPLILGLDAGLDMNRTVDLTAKKLDLDLRVATAAAAPASAMNMLRLLRGDLPYTDPSAVRTVDVEFTVLSDKLATAGCPVPGPPTSEAGAMIFLKLFNDGSSTGASDQTGDYLAMISYDHDTEHTGPYVEGNLFRCADAACSSGDTAATNYPSGKTQFVLGSVAKNTLFRLRLNWDQANHHVLARLGTGADTEIQYVGADDSTPAVVPMTLVGVRVSTGDCTTALRSAKISATVGKVRVNPPPAP